LRREITRVRFFLKRKEFKSRLFKRKISPDDLDYWFYLYADILYRLKQLTDLNCPCTYCRAEKTKLNDLCCQIESGRYIPPHPKAPNITREGNCGRRLGPAA